MDFYIVRFACFKNDTPETFLITDEELDRWFMCEPPEGYACLVILGRHEIDRVTSECINSLKRLMTQGVSELDEPQTKVTDCIYQWDEDSLTLTAIPVDIEEMAREVSRMLTPDGSLKVYATRTNELLATIPFTTCEEINRDDQHTSL